MRLLLVWLALFGVYAATLGLHSFGRSEFGGDEPHYLLIAESIVSDGDVDLTDQYRDRDYAAFYPEVLDPHGRPTAGRLNEPHGVGFPLLIAPAYALAGPTGVQLLMAAIAALAFVLAIRMGRRLVPDPWATAGPLIVALSPPALAYGTAVYPELAAAALLLGAALATLRAREHPRVRTAAGAGLMLALLPWLGTKYLVPGALVGFLLVRWMVRRDRGLAGLIAAEVVFSSLVAFVTVNDRLFGGLTPYAAQTGPDDATGAAFPVGYLDRAYRLVALWIDRDYGLLRWAPFLALAFVAIWLLWRSRRDRIARALPERWEVEAAGALLAAILAGTLLVAAFGSPAMVGFWFPGRHLIAALPAVGALTAWGLRAVPRWLGVVLGALTLGASAWLYVELRLGETGWVAPSSSAPWGPLEGVFPLYGPGTGPWPAVATLLVCAGLLALAIVEWRHWRQIAGAPRRAYPG